MSKRNIFNALSAVILCMYVCVSAGAVTYQDTIDELVNSEKNSAYNIDLNAPFSKDTCGIRESINPENGQLVIAYDMFSAKEHGEDGEMSISVEYCNSYANTKEESAVYADSRYQNVLDDKNTFEKSMEAIGTGWRIKIPYVETTGGKNKTVTYVHLIDGRVYRASDKENSGLENYTLTDISFKKGEITSNNITAYYRIIYADGAIYYFGENGYPVARTDKYNNIIRYVWSADAVPLLTAVYDNCGNVFKLDYADEFTRISYNGRNYELFKSVEDNAKLIKYIRDPDNKLTEFEYTAENMKFNFKLANMSDKENTYYLLSRVKYKTGLKTVYEYTKSTKWLYETTGGYMEYSKISRRYDVDESGVVDEKRYSYYLEPDGYPTYKSSELPLYYIYVSGETKADGSHTGYFYDRDHDQIKKTYETGGKNRTEEIRKYDKRVRMPQQFVVNTYNETDSCRAVYKDTVYDDKGNLLKSDTYQQGEEKGRDVHEYKYSDTNNICTYESSRKDADTLIEAEYSIADGGFGISGRTVKRNGAFVKRDTYSYYANGNLMESRISTGENNSLITRYKYDSSGKYPVEITQTGIRDAGGAVDSYTSRYEYDAWGNVVRLSDNDGNVKTYSYDRLNRVLRETLEDGKTREHIYDDVANIVTEIDANNKKLLCYYDKYGKIVKAEDNNSILLTREYDAEKRLISSTDANGTSTKYEYDGLSRCMGVTVIDADGTILSQKRISYDEAYADSYGDMFLKMTVEDGTDNIRTSEYLFDCRENLVEKRLMPGENARIYRYEYDLSGNCIKEVSPSGGETSIAYDIFANPVRKVLPNGTETFYEYDFAGNCLSEINSLGEKTEAVYDSLSRKISQTTYDGKNKNTEKFYYDSRDNVIVQYDANGNKTENEYNARGFLTAVRQYSNGAEGIVTEYEYDGEGNVTQTSYGGIGTPDRHKYKNTLDLYGRVVKTADSMGFVSLYEYDSAGNLIKQTDPNGVVTSCKYNGLGMITEKNNSLNGRTQYEYDCFGQNVKITDGTGSKVMKYNAFGEPESFVYGANSELFEYDSDGNVIRHTACDKDMGENVTEYGYDKAGFVTEIKTGMGTENITYDGAGRISVRENLRTGISKTYTYCTDGNIRKTDTHRDGKLIYSEEFAYDSNGNKIYANENGNVKRYSYDGMNRLTGILGK